MTMEFDSGTQGGPLVDLLGRCVSGLRVSGIDHMVCSDAGEWRASGDEPSVTLTLERTDYPDNIAILVFDVHALDPGTQGTLYVDYGLGFRAKGSVTLDYGHARTSALILTRLHRIRSLRWVPAGRASGGIRIFAVALVEADAATRMAVRAVPRFGGAARTRVLGAAMALAGLGKAKQAAATFVRTNAALRQGRAVRKVGWAPAASPPLRAGGPTLVTIFCDGAGSQLHELLHDIGVANEAILVLDGTKASPTGPLQVPDGIETVRLGGGCAPAIAYNVGLALARRRGCAFVMFVRGDVRRTGGVLPSLLAEMTADDGLGIVAPSELADEQGGPILLRRAVWDLAAVTFGHDTARPDPRIPRLEADFCEMSCALVRVMAAEAIGGFDEGFGSCREDADFGFRLRERGYGCAALTGVHVVRRARRPVEPDVAHRDTERFVRKHLGYGIRLAEHRLGPLRHSQSSSQSLLAQVRRHGLAAVGRPAFYVGLPGEAPFDYLYTTRERLQPPPQRAAVTGRYRAIFDPSPRSAALFRQGGFDDVHHLPLGIDTDIFHPFGDAARWFDEPTFLWVGQGGGPGGLDNILRAWRRFRASATTARLVLVGSALFERFSQYRSDITCLDGSLGLDLPYDGLHLREVTRDPTDSERAKLYRSVDGLIAAADRNGFDPTVHEAMACGLVTVSPSGPEEPGGLFEGALTVDRDWPVDQVTARLRQAAALSDRDRARIGGASVHFIRSRQTWHQTCFALRAALATVQEQADLPYGLPDPSSALSNLDLALALEKNHSDRLLGGLAVMEPDHPLLEFDPDLYLALNPDVAAAKMDGTAHFLEFGWRESRSLSPHVSSRSYIAANRRARQFLLRSAGIDASDGSLQPPTEDGCPNGESGPTAAPVHDGAHQEANASPRAGTLFVGYVEAGLGLAESLRNLIAAVEASDINPQIYPFNFAVESRYVARFREHLYDLDHAYAVNVFELATDQLPIALKELGSWRTENSYNILRTYWELSKADEGWRSSLSAIDEIWAPTTFIAEAFRPIFDKQILVVPTIVSIEPPANVERDTFGLSKDIFYFIFSFDYYSYPARKNPVGVIRAFAAAFPGVEGVGLVIKTVGPKSLNPRIRAEIEALASSDPRIVVIDESLPREGITALLAACDCYVSLHRSEGFGLGMAESMLLGKPVIGTAYGGCADFLNEQTAFPVRFTLRRLRHGEYPYSDNLEWAEPDHDHAVACLRAVYGDRAEAAARAAAGQRFIKQQFGAASVGAIATGRIHEIVALLGRGRPWATPDVQDDELEV